MPGPVDVHDHLWQALIRGCALVGAGRPPLNVHLLVNVDELADEPMSMLAAVRAFEHPLVNHAINLSDAELDLLKE